MQEVAHTQELAEWDAQIRARNDELTRLTSENTRCLLAVAEQTRSQMDMEHTLATTQVPDCLSPHILPGTLTYSLLLLCLLSCLLTGSQSSSGLLATTQVPACPPTCCLAHSLILLPGLLLACLLTGFPHTTHRPKVLSCLPT